MSLRAFVLRPLIIALTGIGSLLVLVGFGNAAPTGIFPTQFCNTDGTVTIGINWDSDDAGVQRLDVSLSPGFETYNSVSTSSGRAAVEGAKPATEYQVRIVDGDGRSSPAFPIVAIPCAEYPQAETPDCTITPELLASGKLTADDLALRPNRREPVGVYEGEWFATAANPLVTAGRSVGKSVVVIRDVAPLTVTYVFNGNRIDIRNWRFTAGAGNALAVIGGFPPLLFTPQPDGSLKAQALLLGQGVTSEGTFHLCRPPA
jgi:hypothetical protein